MDERASLAQCTDVSVSACTLAQSPAGSRRQAAFGVPGGPATDRPGTDLALPAREERLCVNKRGPCICMWWTEKGEGEVRGGKGKRRLPRRRNTIPFSSHLTSAAAPYLHRVFRRMAGCRRVWLCGCVAGGGRRATGAHGAWRRVYLRIRGRQSQRVHAVSVSLPLSSVRRGQARLLYEQRGPREALLCSPSPNGSICLHLSPFVPHPSLHHPSLNPSIRHPRPVPVSSLGCRVWRQGC
jgi:hypothetical protein